jgi:hypothetical protein
MAVSRSGARAKGNKAENEVCDFLRSHLGGHVSRGRLEGSEDRGDIVGTPSLANQVKSYEDVARAINDGLNDVTDQKARAGARWGAVWVRRRGGRYFVVLSPEDFISLYKEARRGEV